MMKIREMKEMKEIDVNLMMCDANADAYRRIKMAVSLQDTATLCHTERHGAWTMADVAIRVVYGMATESIRDTAQWKETFLEDLFQEACRALCDKPHILSVAQDIKSTESCTMREAWSTACFKTASRAVYNYKYAQKQNRFSGTKRVSETKVEPTVISQIGKVTVYGYIEPTETVYKAGQFAVDLDSYNGSNGMVSKYIGTMGDSADIGELLSQVRKALPQYCDGDTLTVALQVLQGVKMREIEGVSHRRYTDATRAVRNAVADVTAIYG